MSRFWHRIDRARKRTKRMHFKMDDFLEVLRWFLGTAEGGQYSIQLSYGCEPSGQLAANFAPFQPFRPRL
jgi:hypothetical protein